MLEQNSKAYTSVCFCLFVLSGDSSEGENRDKYGYTVLFLWILKSCFQPIDEEEAVFWFTK